MRASAPWPVDASLLLSLTTASRTLTWKVTQLSYPRRKHFAGSPLRSPDGDNLDNRGGAGSNASLPLPHGFCRLLFGARPHCCGHVAPTCRR